MNKQNIYHAEGALNPGDFVRHDPRKLTKEDLENYIKNNNVPKGACVCISKDNSIVVDWGDADPIEFKLWANEIASANLGHFLDKRIKEVCSGLYIKNGG